MNLNKIIKLKGITVAVFKQVQCAIQKGRMGLSNFR